MTTQNRQKSNTKKKKINRKILRFSLYWDKSKGAEICCYEKEQKNMENVIKPNNIE